MYYGNTSKPPVKANLSMPALRPEQLAAVHRISSRSTLLLADVGAGKTATALTAIIHRGNRRTLVLGTKRICESVWPEEVAKWAPHLRYASVAGLSEKKRIALMEDQSIDIIGLNYENLIWAVKIFGRLLPFRFPNLVPDESSKLENPKSKSFKAIKPLLPLFEWRLPMTGTPRANHLYDLWGNAYLADLGTALGDYREAFLQCFFRQVHRRVGIDWIPLHGAEEEIYERLRPTVYRMPFKWHAPVEIDVVLPLNPKVKMIQDQLDKELKEIEDVEIHGITYARDGNRASTKMFQLSSGFVYDDSGEVHVIHRDKIDALREIIDEAHGEPVMVVFAYIHERDAILAAFPQARILDGPDTIAAWNEGRIEVLLVHPLSCGHGLNAQFSGCDLQVWFTPTTDAELYSQTIGRLNRPGNDKTIRVVRLIMQGTKDRAAYNVVAARQRGEHVTLDAFE